MITNTSSTALNMITNAQHKAADAAHKIATFPVAEDEAGSTDFSSNSLLSPIISLKEAEIEASAAIKVLQADEERIGSLFDALS